MAVFDADGGSSNALDDDEEEASFGDTTPLLLLLLLLPPAPSFGDAPDAFAAAPGERDRRFAWWCSCCCWVDDVAAMGGDVTPLREVEDAVAVAISCVLGVTS